MKRSIRDKFEKLSSFSDEELRELRDYILIEANELKHKPIERFIIRAEEERFEIEYQARKLKETYLEMEEKLNQYREKVKRYN